MFYKIQNVFPSHLIFFFCFILTCFWKLSILPSDMKLFSFLLHCKQKGSQTESSVTEAFLLVGLFFIRITQVIQHGRGQWQALCLYTQCKPPS